MTTAQRQLLETLSGHIALLQTAYPRKAASTTARRARKYVQAKLRLCPTRATRLAA